MELADIKRHGKASGAEGDEARLERVTSVEERATNIAISCENARDEVLELS